jgi:hypothetical protein
MTESPEYMRRHFGLVADDPVLPRTSTPENLDRRLGVNTAGEIYNKSSPSIFVNDIRISPDYSISTEDALPIFVRDKTYQIDVQYVTDLPMPKASRERMTTSYILETDQYRLEFSGVYSAGQPGEPHVINFSETLTVKPEAEFGIVDVLYGEVDPDPERLTQLLRQFRIN